MGRTKITPRLIVEWEDGLDKEPVGFPIADTDEEVERLQMVFKKIAQQGEREAKVKA